MSAEKKSASESSAQLGSSPECRTHRYFCIDDDQCKAFSRVSKEATHVRKIPKRIKVLGEEIDGWIVELRVPATDGVVREDPLKEFRNA